MRYVVTALLGLLFDVLIVWLALGAAKAGVHVLGVMVGGVVAFLLSLGAVQMLETVYGYTKVWPSK